MTKKDFENIAEVFWARRVFLEKCAHETHNGTVDSARWYLRLGELDQIVETMIVQLECEYPKFDPAKFRRAVYNG